MIESTAPDETECLLKLATTVLVVTAMVLIGFMADVITHQDPV